MNKLTQRRAKKITITERFYNHRDEMKVFFFSSKENALSESNIIFNWHILA